MEKILTRKISLILEVSELTNKIDSLENKIFEQVGVDGSDLSGGEKQRIALARAIYKSSRNFIFRRVYKQSRCYY